MVIKKETLTEIYTSLNWALLTLGASELVLIVRNSLLFLITTFACACIFVIYVLYVNAIKASLKKFVRLLLFCTSGLLLLKWLYVHFILIEVPAGLYPLNLLAIVIFLATGLIGGFLSIKLSNGTR